MTTPLRSSNTQRPISNQETALVLEFNCLYTHDIRRKAKRWQDGFLRFHTFNKRVMVYDIPRNFIGDSHWRRDEYVAEGDELELERAAALVQVGEALGSKTQDISGLHEKQDVQQVEKRKAAARLLHTGREHGVPLKALVQRTSASLNEMQKRGRLGGSLQDKTHGHVRSPVGDQPRSNATTIESGPTSRAPGPNREQQPPAKRRKVQHKPISQPIKSPDRRTSGNEQLTKTPEERSKFCCSGFIVLSDLECSPTSPKRSKPGRKVDEKPMNPIKLSSSRSRHQLFCQTTSTVKTKIDASAKNEQIDDRQTLSPTSRSVLTRSKGQQARFDQRLSRNHDSQKSASGYDENRIPRRQQLPPFTSRIEPQLQPQIGSASKGDSEQPILGATARQTLQVDDRMAHSLTLGATPKDLPDSENEVFPRSIGKPPAMQADSQPLSTTPKSVRRIASERSVSRLLPNAAAKEVNRRQNPDPLPKQADQDVGPWSSEAYDLFGLKTPQELPLLRDASTAGPK